MANKKTLKGYFETGDIPNQSQYHELINSNLNLNETGTQILVGTLSSSFLEVENHITASGNISSSGQIDADKIRTGGRIASSVFDIACVGSIDTDGTISSTGISNSSTYTGGGRIILSGAFSYIETPSYVSASSLISQTHITASGNISSSGEVYAQQYFIENRSILDYSTSGEILRLGYNNDTNTISIGRTGVTTQLILNAPVTASGNISSSGTITAEHFHSSDDLTVTDNLLVGSLANGVALDKDTGITTTGIAGNITASGNISSSGNISANGATIVEQLDITSTTDSIFNMYMNGSLNTSFHSRGNLHSFVEAGTSVANFGVGTITPAEKLTVHGNISGSGNLKIDGSQVDFTNLPTSDPSVAGRLYREGTDLKISLG